MNEEMRRLLTFIIFAMGFTLMFFVMFFGTIRADKISIDYDDVCKYNYGGKYIYEKDNDFGTYCIELIHENLTKINPKPFDWSNEEIIEMCKPPEFFDLKRWDNGICNIEKKGVGE